MRFSERHGFKPVREAIQLESMDAELRTALWNAVHLAYLRSKAYELSKDQALKHVAMFLQIQFFNKPIDELEFMSDAFISRVKQWFFSCEWHEVYDFIEHINKINFDDRQHDVSAIFLPMVNHILEKEKSGYRFVGDQITKIVGEAEISAIEKALSARDKFSGAREHIRTALQHYSNRREPDYRNSIKEAISAIESAACIITNDPKATLGNALKALRKRHEIHPGMSEAFEKLYGYTSDSGGIRHKMLDEQTIKDHEALFMLVTCSAFLNYLISSSG